MSIVTLTSGGLDSTVMALLVREEGLEQFPLFINYGQINLKSELAACINNFKRFSLPDPKVMDISGYGAIIDSGLTNKSKDILKEAFLPCRNLMFLVAGSAYACQKGATSVAIGLLDDAFSLFPDQTKGFIAETESLISRGVGRKIQILTPLMSFSKAEVVAIAKSKGVSGTYSCHAGKTDPCGVCIACREYNGIEV